MRKSLFPCFLLAVCIACTAQERPASTSELEQLRQQMNDTRAQLSEARTQLTASSRQIEELRRDVDQLRKQVLPATVSAAEGEPKQPAQAAGEPTVANADKDPGFLAAKVQELHQVKVESASKYPVKISGLVLFNAFHNNGDLDITDQPNLVNRKPAGVPRANIGATLRQSLFNIEVRGPEVFGAETSADVSVDFFGGSPTTNYGITNGIIRLRTANAHLDWGNTSLHIGQDVPFISPLSPTSYASVAEPALAWAGNLWVWTPQIVLEHRISTGENTSLVLQGGLLDPLTEQEPPFQGRIPTAGENSGYPMFAGRISLDRTGAARFPFVIGFAGTRGQQKFNSPVFPPVDLPAFSSWTLNADFKIPVGNYVELSGEWYYGQAAGGLGGGIWNSAAMNLTQTSIHPLRSVGGWGQLKVTPTPRFEFNAAMGQDENISKDVHFFSIPLSVGYGSPPLVKNRAEYLNVIFKPNSVLLFAAEIRRLFTLPFFGPGEHGNQLNLSVGVRF